MVNFPGISSLLDRCISETIEENLVVEIIMKIFTLRYMYVNSACFVKGRVACFRQLLRFYRWKIKASLAVVLKFASCSLVTELASGKLNANSTGKTGVRLSLTKLIKTERHWYCRHVYTQLSNNFGKCKRNQYVHTCNFASFSLGQHYMVTIFQRC